MDTSQATKSFRGLLLRHRGRTRLTQRELAARAGVSFRSLQDWEAGVTLPTATRLQKLVRALLEAGSFTTGLQTSEARELWTALEREAPRMHASFDAKWFAGLLATPPSSSHGRQPASLSGSDDDGERAQDWGDAPDTTRFVGRAQELALLHTWVLQERCRVVALLGMGGIGKTILAARLAQTLAPSVDYVYWRSLRDAPPIGGWLSGAIGFLSNQRVVPPASEAERLIALLQLLRARRCLLVLDNSETLLEPGQLAGRYRAGMEGYGRLLEAIAETSHRSCLVLTSREMPAELAMFAGGVRRMQLEGLGKVEAEALLADKQLRGGADDWRGLVHRYGGNGLALKIVGETIREVYDRDIAGFVEDAAATFGTVFGGIRRLLAVQVERLSAVERDVLMRLAVEREPVSVAGLTAIPVAADGTVVEAIENLRRRSLVERGENGATFTLQSMVLEYVTDRLVETAVDEIGVGSPVVLLEHPLIKAQAKDYVRQAQELLIGAPVLQRLRAQHGDAGAEHRLIALLDICRGRPAAEQGFAPGNAVNLLRLLRGHLRGLDLSRLVIRQAHLADVDAQDTRFVGAHVTDAVFADAFTFPICVAVSYDGASLAAGTSDGEVWHWRIADRTPQLAIRGHAGPVYGIALSADGRLLASGGEGGMVRLWHVFGGRALATLLGHEGIVWGVALSGDGHLLASGGADGTVRLWETPGGRPLATLLGHVGTVRAVALSLDGRLLASGGVDGTVRLWETRSGRCIARFGGHTGGARGVALSADGRVLVSGSTDGPIRIWAAPARQLVASLEEGAGGVRALALSQDGHVLASGSFDGPVRLWEVPGGRPIATLQGHTGTVWGIALNADGRVLASGSLDGTIRLWETAQWRQLAAMRGRTGSVWGVALSADGRTLGTGSMDGSIRLWEAETGRLLAMWDGRGGGIRGVSLSADGQLLASGGTDGKIRLWDPASGRSVGELPDHTGTVWGVALSGDGRVLATSSTDGPIRLWDTASGQQLASMPGDTGGVRGIALSANGQLLAGGGLDGGIRLWDVRSERLQARWDGHAGTVWGIALTADGELLATGSMDGSMRLFETSSGHLRATLHGHKRGGEGQATGVWGVALSGDGRLLASGGQDGTVTLWETSAGTRLHVLQDDRRYERANITGLTGVTVAQRVALRALGAVDRSRNTHADEPTHGQ